MRSTPRTFAYSLLIFLFLPCLTTAQRLSVNEIANQLRVIKIKPEDFPAYDVPAMALPLLPQWKLGIRRIIADAVLSPKSAGVEPAKLRSSLLSALRDQGIVLASGEPQYYGQLVKLEVLPVDRFPQLLTVTTAINMECGHDESLDVFEKLQSGWKLVLSYSADEYKQIDGAHENLEFRFSPRHDSPYWYVLIAHSPAWCTSCWSSLHYKLLRPGGVAEKPEILYAGESGFYRCADKPVALQASPSEFSLAYVDMMTLDFDLFTKIAVDRFSLTDAGVRRLPPLHQNAVDFINEWSQLPEQESSALVAPDAMATAFQWHERLSHLSNGKDGEPVRSRFEFEQACSRDASRWQVKLAFEHGADSNAPPALYFVLNVTHQGIYLQSVGTTEDATCTGPHVSPEGANLKDLDLP